jgi:RimJ/RimL family protein N-acetyltransferase
MADLKEFDIRYTRVTDISYLKEWVRKPEVLYWFPMSDEKEIEDALRCWIAYCQYNCSLTATVENVPCGIGTLFLMPYKKVCHHCIFKIVVDPKMQRKGIGSSLVKNLKHLAKNYFKLEFMHIEVFEGNPLISLLHKFDFYEFARQENYVKNAGTYQARVMLETQL